MKIYLMRIIRTMSRTLKKKSTASKTGRKRMKGGVSTWGRFLGHMTGKHTEKNFKAKEAANMGKVSSFKGFERGWLNRKPKNNTWRNKELLYKWRKPKYEKQVWEKETYWMKLLKGEIQAAAGKGGAGSAVHDAISWENDAMKKFNQMRNLIARQPGSILQIKNLLADAYESATKSFQYWNEGFQRLNRSVNKLCKIATTNKSPNNSWHGSNVSLFNMPGMTQAWASAAAEARSRAQREGGIIRELVDLLNGLNKNNWNTIDEQAESISRLSDVNVEEIQKKLDIATNFSSSTDTSLFIDICTASKNNAVNPTPAAIPVSLARGPPGEVHGTAASSAAERAVANGQQASPTASIVSRSRSQSTHNEGYEANNEGNNA